MDGCIVIIAIICIGHITWRLSTGLKGQFYLAITIVVIVLVPGSADTRCNYNICRTHTANIVIDRHTISARLGDGD